MSFILATIYKKIYIAHNYHNNMANTDLLYTYLLSNITEVMAFRLGGLSVTCTLYTLVGETYQQCRYVNDNSHEQR